MGNGSFGSIAECHCTCTDWRAMTKIVIPAVPFNLNPIEFRLCGHPPANQELSTFSRWRTMPTSAETIHFRRRRGSVGVRTLVASASRSRRRACTASWCSLGPRSGEMRVNSEKGSAAEVQPSQKLATERDSLMENAKALTNTDAKRTSVCVAASGTNDNISDVSR